MPHNRISLISFHTAFFLVSVRCARFDHNVVTAKPSPDGVYRFVFDVRLEPLLSISVPQDKRYIPLHFNTTDTKFYQRDYSFAKGCSVVHPVNKKILNDIVYADGRHRTVITVNGQIPGPPIVVPKSAMVEVVVQNHNKDESGLTIHFHGLTQRGNFHMDGVNFIQQCPINVGSIFTYRFRADDAGTHWWHAHSKTQRADGVYGPLVIQDRGEPKVDREYFLIIQDWTLKRSFEINVEHEWHAKKFQNGFENMDECFFPDKTPDGGIHNSAFESILINGRGWHGIHKWPPNYQSVNASKYPIERFNVSADQTVRFRVVGAAVAQMLMISIDEHNLTITATDGHPIQPISAQYLIVNSGERYDFTIRTKSGKLAKKNFWLRVRTMETHYFNETPSREMHYGLAILHYTAMNNDYTVKSAEPQCTRKVPCIILNCPGQLHTNWTCILPDQMQSAEPELSPTLLKTHFKKGELEEHFLNFHFTGNTTKIFNMVSAVNQYQFAMPIAPLFQYRNISHVTKSCDKCKLDQYCECTNILPLTLGKITQFVIYNIGNGATKTAAHPVHLHGHHFRVLKIGYPRQKINNSTGFYQYVSQTADIACRENEPCYGRGWANNSWINGAIPKLNLVNPPYKDTLVLPIDAYAVLRFEANNPGWWVMHCHVDTHHSEGMQLIVREGTPEEILKATPIVQNFPTCHPLLPNQAKPSQVNSGYKPPF